jgi:hypothetical protein
MSLRAKILFILLFGSKFLGAQEKLAPDYQVKAAFLYNFTRFVTWPPSAYSDRDAPIVIAIVGDDPFGSYLDKLVDGAKVENRPIVVHRYEVVSTPSSAHIVFVTFKDPLKIKEAIAGFNPENTLFVGEATNFCQMGGHAQFIKTNGKIRIQINMAAANKSRLEISSKLLRTAKIIKSKNQNEF